MASSSSSSSSSVCQDDDNNEKSIFDDPNFFIQASSLTMSVQQFSSVGNIFLDGKVSTSSVFASRKRVASPSCLNCFATVRKLVFNCACSVECALAYHLVDKDVYDFIQARYRMEEHYAKLPIVPRPKMSIKAGPLYDGTDQRWIYYANQLESNVINESQKLKH